LQKLKRYTAVEKKYTGMENFRRYGIILTECRRSKDIARRTQGEDKENTRRRGVKLYDVKKWVISTMRKNGKIVDEKQPCSKVISSNI